MLLRRLSLVDCGLSLVVVVRDCEIGEVREGAGERPSDPKSQTTLRVMSTIA